MVSFSLFFLPKPCVHLTPHSSSLYHVTTVLLLFITLQLYFFTLSRYNRTSSLHKFREQVVKNTAYLRRVVTWIYNVMFKLRTDKNSRTRRWLEIQDVLRNYVHWPGPTNNIPGIRGYAAHWLKTTRLVHTRHREEWRLMT